MAEKTLADLLNPGRKVEIRRGDAVVLTATVYEVGMPHIQRYPELIGQAIAKLLMLGIDKAAGKPPPGAQYMAEMLPFVLKHMMPLVKETTKLEPGGISLDQIPHHDLAEIASAWMLENFGTEEKWGPWAAVADQMMAAVLRQDAKIWETVSSILSKRGSPSETSSTVRQEAVPATPIQDGP